MKTSLILAAALVLLHASLSAQTVDPAKRQQVEELIRLTKLDAAMGPVIDQCIVLAKSHNPSVPDTFWQQEKRIMANDLTTYLDAETAIFGKYLSTDDLKALVAFYKTPAGQHYIQVLPALTQEGMQSMQAWAKGLSAGTVQRLREAGYTLGK